MSNLLPMMHAIPVVHKEIAYEGEQQQDDGGVQLELLIFIFVGKSAKTQDSIYSSQINAKQF